MSLAPPPALKENFTGLQPLGSTPRAGCKRGSGAALPKPSLKKDQILFTYFFFTFQSVMDQYFF